MKNPVVNITVMALITVGGIGFLVWEDLVRNRMRLTHCRLQTKVVLAASLFLDLVPAALFYFCEYRGISGGTRILAALFQSVTCRTAGFNTTDLTRFSDSGIVLMNADRRLPGIHGGRHEDDDGSASFCLGHFRVQAAG